MTKAQTGLIKEKMRFHRTSIWHELLILFIYFLFSPFVYRIFYGEPLTGYEQLMYYGILILTCFTMLVSILLIGLGKLINKNNSFELKLGLIPLSLSTPIVEWLRRF